jgi:hypothetical protein
MRMHKRLMRLAISSFAGLIVLAGLAGSTPPGSVGVVSAQEEPEEQYHPCGVEAKRVIEPRIVEEGGVISVKVHYDYNCISGKKTINFIMLIEATISEQNITDRNGLQLNLKEGLKNFVNKTTFSNGTTGGLTLVGTDHHHRVPLRGGVDGRQDLLDGIESISLKPISSQVGFGAALVDAVGRLPTNVADAAENWVIIFDRGADEVINNEEPPVTIADGCKRAVRSKVNVAVVSHQDAPYRFTCVTRGYARRSSGAKAPDLPQIFDSLADSIVSGKQARETVYQDYAFNDAFAYVEASGRPRDPDDVRGSPPYDITWKSKDNTKPPGGFNIDYQWRALTDLTDPVTKISVTDFPSILFLWADGSYDEFTLDDPVNNPEVCVYRKGKMQQDCGNFSTYTPTPEAETPTPEPETPTPTATDVLPTTPPTVVVPTNTPVPTTAVPPTVPATYTPVPTPAPLPGLYLPALLRADNLGSL